MTRPFIVSLAALAASSAAFGAWVYAASLPAPSDAHLDIAAAPLVVPANAEVAVFSGGCFWGTQEAFRTVPGVLATQTGYTGGTAPNPTYRTSHEKGSGYRESCEIVYDPAKVNYETLLRTFLAAHDPTAPRPKSPAGSAYRSFVWTQNAGQRETAKAVIASLDASGRFAFPIQTQVQPATRFHPAELRHQNYYADKNGAVSCQR